MEIYIMVCKMGFGNHNFFTLKLYKIMNYIYVTNLTFCDKLHFNNVNFVIRKYIL